MKTNIKTRTDSKHNRELKFMHAAIEVVTTDTRDIRYVDILEDIREIKLSDTGGLVYKYFKEDLIEGLDRFLVYVFETGRNYYKFDVIIKTDNVQDFLYHTGTLTRYVVDKEIESQTVFTAV
jgi:hypothetical protein